MPEQLPPNTATTATKRLTSTSVRTAGCAGRATLISIRFISRAGARIARRMHKAGTPAAPNTSALRVRRGRTSLWGTPTLCWAW